MVWTYKIVFISHSLPVSPGSHKKIKGSSRFFPIHDLIFETIDQLYIYHIRFLSRVSLGPSNRSGDAVCTISFSLVYSKFYTVAEVFVRLLEIKFTLLTPKYWQGGRKNKIFGQWLYLHYIIYFELFLLCFFANLMLRRNFGSTWKKNKALINTKITSLVSAKVPFNIHVTIKLVWTIKSGKG